MKKENDYSFDSENTTISFKKVLHGYSPDEVTAYISEINNNMRDASKNFEARMAEINQELTLANRENSTLRSKCASLEVKLATALALNGCDSRENYDSSEESADSLKSYLEKEKNAREAAESELQSTSLRIDELLKQLREKENEIAGYMDRIDELELQNDNRSKIGENYETALAEIETMKSEFADMTEEKTNLEELVRENKARLSEADNENKALKTEVNRLTVENELLAKKNEQHKIEINELKNDAKAKAYEYAECIAEEKAALDREKTAVQKKLQLQVFHVEQAASAVDELKKQIEQIKNSFNE